MVFWGSFEGFDFFVGDVGQNGVRGDFCAGFRVIVFYYFGFFVESYDIFAEAVGFGEGVGGFGVDFGGIGHCSAGFVEFVEGWGIDFVSAGGRAKAKGGSEQD